ncbi:MAG: glycosyltransferase family 4 protein [Culicoidibacterales bacterium]
MAILQVMSYDSYPFDSEKNFITHPQNGLERHLSGLHQKYWEKNYYLLINDYNQSLSVKRFNLEGDIEESYQLSQEMTNQFNCQNQAQLQENLQMIVEECKVEVVHFHFQKPIALDMITIFKKFETIRLIQTMHDLSYACGGYYEDYTYQVPKFVEQTINQLDNIIFPDKSVEQIYRKQMNVGVKTTVIGHGVEMMKLALSKNQNTDFKVLFLGAFGKEKGGDLVAEVVQAALDGVSWHILGRIETKSLKDVNTYTYHGSYTSYDLQAKLEEIQPDLIVLPSQMIETFSYNLADSLAAGVPVLVPKKGAFLRIEGSQVGWFVEDEQSAKNYQKIIREVANSPEKYQVVKEKCLKYKTRDVHEMNQEYAEFYLIASNAKLTQRIELKKLTNAYEKKQYQQLVHTHQAFLQEQENAKQHLEAYGVLADKYNNLANEYRRVEIECASKNEQVENLETLLSKRIVGKINRYLLNKDNVSKK